MPDSLTLYSFKKILEAHTKYLCHELVQVTRTFDFIIQNIDEISYNTWDCIVTLGGVFLIKSSEQVTEPFKSVTDLAPSSCLCSNKSKIVQKM